MNERIKLPVQEWLGYDPEKGDIHGYTFDQMREFAELIIRECADIASINSHQYETSGEYVLKHFGVGVNKHDCN